VSTTGSDTLIPDLAARTRFVPHAGSAEGPREETSLLAFLTILLDHRRLIVLSMLIGMAIWGALAANQASLYLSRSSFIVKGSRAPLQIAGGAAALGVSLAAAAEFSQSIVFYGDLVRAKTILVPVAERSYETVDSKGAKRPLPEILGIKSPTRRGAAIQAAEYMKPYVASNIYSRSGIVGLSVQTADPMLSQQINAAVLTELDEYSKTRRYAQAVAERKFIEGLVDNARIRLAEAEQTVSNFLADNREYQSSPQLTLEHDRLQRDVVMRQQIYTSLAESLEQARVEEIRNPSALSIVEPPDLPADPQTTTALRKTLLGAAVGLLVGIVLAFLLQRFHEQERIQSEAFRRLVSVLRSSPRSPA
jgi:uncharacterized protein involved in exopolysaccharide biosynthesis